MKKSKKSKVVAKTKSTEKTAKVKTKSKLKPKKATPKKGVSLEALVAEIEKISSRLDNLEKEIRNLKGIAYPIGA